MFRFILFVVSIVIALLGTTTAEGDSKSYTALRFAYDSSSHIAFDPDMSSMTEKFSVCLWIKKIVSGNGNCPFAYGGHTHFEIFMTDSGYYNRLFKSTSLDGTLTSKFTTTAGNWYTYCSTWSLASRTFRVYVNGHLAGTQTTPSGRRLTTGYKLVLGAYHTDGAQQFGGEIFNLNVFSKELTATEIAIMAAKGLCTDTPEELEDYRIIKWEQIMKLTRSGTVTDVIDPRCVAAHELQGTKRKLETAVGEKNSVELSQNLTRAELLKVQGLFNSTQEDLEEVKRELNETKSALVDTQSELEDAQSELEDTQSELKNVTEYKCPISKGNVTKWDIFYSPTYYNKPFTRRLYQQLRTTWDSVSKQLFGVTMTDTIIKLAKNLDCEDKEFS
ncbi:uncharacterized protein LOC134817860 [Bolinopsis microptera]|uniref:uncharacterized protein LOC134817860 n=1 Tax=Bolinopsis microptera TaxID=2820187 RepID=UPI00307948FD